MDFSEISRLIMNNSHAVPLGKGMAETYSKSWSMFTK